jgi:large subunit ribosomal protein L17
VLRIEPVKEDQAESAILELVDGPKDMRFAMTAKTLSHIPEDKCLNEMTAKNVKKVTQFRENGMETLREMVSKMKEHKAANWDDRTLAAPKRVYLYEERNKRDMHYPEQVDDWVLPNPVLHEPGVVAPKGMRVNHARAYLRKSKNKKTNKERKEATELAKADAAMAELNLST